jgi:uncharacterized OsmC-like protein
MPRASGRATEVLSCNVQRGKALIEAGLHRATGGDGSLAKSCDILLEALVACAGVTLRAVAILAPFELRDATITAEGDHDVRGTLGVSKDVPVGFKSIQLRSDPGSSASEADHPALLRLRERFCVVLWTLRQAPAISIEMHS